MWLFLGSEERLSNDGEGRLFFLVSSTDGVALTLLNHSEGKILSLRAPSTIREFSDWHLENFYAWCQSDCTRLKLDFCPGVVPNVCVCQVVQEAASLNAISEKSPRLQRRQFLCVSISCPERFVCFLALQGESLELENVLSGFIMRRLFYCCALSIKSHRILNAAAAVCCNHNRVKQTRWRNNCSPVWCLMEKVTHMIFFFNSPVSVLNGSVDGSVVNWAESLLPKFNCASFKSPLTTAVGTR